MTFEDIDRVIITALEKCAAFKAAPWDFLTDDERDVLRLVALDAAQWAVRDVRESITRHEVTA